MGGAVRRVRKAVRKLTNPIRKVADEAFEELIEKPVKKATKETAKAAGIIPTNKQIAEAETAQKKAQEAQKAQMQSVIDAQSKANPADVVYTEEQKGKRRRKRRRARSIMTSAQGVIGSADTDKKTLLGG